MPSDFSVKTKIIPSSEFLSLELETETEESIPHPKDPIRDMARNYWVLSEDGNLEKTDIPSSNEENKVYLNEDRNFYTILVDEFVRILEYKYDDVLDEENIILMKAGAIT